MDVNAYARQLKQLLPTGAAWNVDFDSVLSKFVRGLAEELARVDARARTLIDESDPRTCTETFEDWERVFGLPDECVTDPQSIIQRRMALIARVVGRGGQTPQYYIDIAAALAFTITITEFRPFTVGSPCSDPILGQGWAYAWQVNAPLNTVTVFTVQSGAGDALASWGNAILECVLTRLKPAHTTLIFSYT